jgi:hypothetical protein
MLLIYAAILTVPRLHPQLEMLRQTMAMAANWQRIELAYRLLLQTLQCSLYSVAALLQDIRRYRPKIHR